MRNGTCVRGFGYAVQARDTRQRSGYWARHRLEGGIERRRWTREMSLHRFLSVVFVVSVTVIEIVKLALGFACGGGRTDQADAFTDCVKLLTDCLFFLWIGVFATVGRIWRLLVGNPAVSDSWEWYRWEWIGRSNGTRESKIWWTSGRRGFVGKVFFKRSPLRRVGDRILLEILINFLLYTI